MPEYLRTNFKRQAAAFLSATALIGAVQANYRELPANAADTITFRVLEHTIDTSGRASLKVDARTINENKWAIMTDQVTKVAILMPGASSSSLCPYFDLARYKHSINQIEANKLDFQIDVQIKPDEARKAQESKCLVVNMPPRSAINWKY